MHCVCWDCYVNYFDRQSQRAVPAYLGANFRLGIDVIANIRKTFAARCMVTSTLG